MPKTTVIHNDDIVLGVRDALQYISYYHNPDFVAAMTRAYENEQSPAAKDAIAQILINSKLCALGKRPICQDTGIVDVFIDIGMDVRFAGDTSLEDLVNAGVRAAYLDVDNPLRASIVRDPLGKRENTGDNTPAVVHMHVVPGNTVTMTVVAKGGGSENKSRLGMCNPSDSLVDWVLKTVPGMGAGWCPPGVLGIGVGGTAEKAMFLAKKSLLSPIDIDQIQASGPRNHIEALRLELYQKVNALGIGAQGLGGLTTVLDVKILSYPTHAASLPVGMIPNCAANRYVRFTLDGNGVPKLPTPDLSLWPTIERGSTGARRVDLDTLTRDDVRHWRAGDTLLLSGTMLTGRDAAHKRFVKLINDGEKLPIDLDGKFLYYVGPVDAVRDEVVGPAGPTTATRMDKFLNTLLPATGLLGMIGKAERGNDAVQTIAQHGCVYLIAVGGAAYLVAQAIREAKVVAFADLGMEAVYSFRVQDMPVTVAVDVQGNSVHKTGPERWRQQVTLT